MDNPLELDPRFVLDDLRYVRLGACGKVLYLAMRARAALAGNVAVLPRRYCKADAERDSGLDRKTVRRWTDALRACGLLRITRRGRRWVVYAGEESEKGS